MVIIFNFEHQQYQHGKIEHQFQVLGLAQFLLMAIEFVLFAKGYQSFS
jgi:hypothetical protein